MRRAIVYITIAFLVLLVGAWWYFFRVTPERALALAIRNFARSEQISSLRGSVFWDRGSDTRGFVLDKWISYAGRVNMSDPTAPRAAGVMGVAETASGEDFQTTEIRLTGDTFAFRSREVNDDFLEWIDGIAGTSTHEIWVSAERNAVLEEFDYPEWISVGAGRDLRGVLEKIDTQSMAIPVPGTINEYVIDGRPVADMSVHLNQTALERAIVSLVSAWNLQDPTTEDVQKLQRIARGAAEGEWYVSIDMVNRTFRSIQGTWNLLDTARNVNGHVTIQLEFDGWNERVRITALQSDEVDVIELTEILRGPAIREFPGAGERILPLPELESEPETSGTTSTYEESS